MQPSEVRRHLMDWYDLQERSLPWRRTKDPYLVLVSEIMLQQTRVEVVERRFEAFVKRFPDVGALARASEDELLKAWEGLGYYSRARNLHRAAIAVMELHRGRIPSSKEELLALPGIGPYTAGALLAIAFGRPEPAVDANVQRIFSRLLALDADPRKGEGRSCVEEAVHLVMPPERPADYTQALMDLGQLLCLPKSPRCVECPLTGQCAAYRTGCEALFPKTGRPLPKKEEELTAMLLTDGHALALEKRPSSGILASMYGPPLLEGSLDAGQMRTQAESMGFAVEEVRAIEPWKHVFTHRVWHLTGFVVRVRDRMQTGMHWADREDLETVTALPTAFLPAVRGWMSWQESSGRRPRKHDH